MSLLLPGYWAPTYFNGYWTPYWPIAQGAIPDPPAAAFGPQQGDVLLFQTDNDGDLNIEGGLVQMTGQLKTAVYLSLFGGNEHDNGRTNGVNGWWGNVGETDPARKLVSKTQNLINYLPAISANLKRLEEAVKADLQWILDNKIASVIIVEVSIPRLNQIQIDIEISAIGNSSQFTFIENWKAAT